MYYLKLGQEKKMLGRHPRPAAVVSGVPLDNGTTATSPAFRHRWFFTRSLQKSFTRANEPSENRTAMVA
jgi:hypothetical protein